MLQTLRKRLAGRSEEGFTLIELMVVVLIIAILLAIAIPTFLGARTKAQDRAAQSDLRNALTTEKTFYVDAQQYTGSTTALALIEPHLVFGAAASNTVIGVNSVSSATGTNDVVCMSKKSASGTWFGIWENAGTGTYFGKAAGSGADPLATCPTTNTALLTAGFVATGF